MSHLRASTKSTPGILDSALWRNISRAVKFNLRQIFRPAAVKIDNVMIGVDYEGWSPQMVRRVLRGDYEERERKTIAKALSRSDRVLEIGGGIGLIALSVRETAPQSRIWIYEANPELVEEMKQNFARNDAEIFVEHAAVVPASVTTEVVRFHIAKDFWSSSLLPVAGGAREISAPAKRLDDVIKRHAPNVLIMDVEGAECDLLDQCDLAGVEKMIIEFHQRATGRTRANALIERLLYSGFEMDLDHSEREVLLFVRARDAKPAAAHRFASGVEAGAA